MVLYIKQIKTVTILSIVKIKRFLILIKKNIEVLQWLNISYIFVENYDWIRLILQGKR